MRILIVTTSLPYPPNWGGGIRVYQFVRNLSRHHEVTLLTFGSPGDGEKIEALKKICYAVHTVPPPFTQTGSKRIVQMKSLLSSRSFAAGGITGAPMQAKINALLEQQFDLVQVEFGHLSGYNFGSSVPVILDEHNIEYELLYRMYQSERTGFRRFYNWLEYKKYQQEERALWRRVDACVFTSERETNMVREQIPGIQAKTAPNGVDIEYFQDSAPEEDQDSLVFTGLISYRPNTDAVLYFSHEIMPLILQRRPQTVFNIVGMGPTPEVRRLQGPNIHVTGEVPDVRPYIARAGVLVVPLRMGSGTRLKVLEGLSMSKAVVSTTVGCEGIEVRADEHLRIADTPEAFANAVIAMQERREEAAAMGRRGRALVEQRYSWASITDDLESFHQEVLANWRTKHRVA
ncbi:MAG: glycosyltransferase [Cytophagales bacterium]|nr:glycosyltransferase [Armatimonadota bacterium]